MVKQGRQRTVVVVLLLALLGGLSGRVAWAHVSLITAVPEPGSTLTSSPPEVQLTFDGEILPARSEIALFDHAFQRILGVTMRPESTDNTELAAQIPPLAPGRYTVHWLVVSTDEHALRGSYAFALAEPAHSLFPRAIIPALIILSLLTAGAAVIYRLRRRTPPNEEETSRAAAHHHEWHRSAVCQTAKASRLLALHLRRSVNSPHPAQKSGERGI